MSKTAFLLFALVLLAPPCLSAEDALQEWTMTSQAVFKGTFLKYEDDFMYFKMEDGSVREFPKAQGASETIGYVQRLICKFPEKIGRPQVSPDRKLLIDLSVDDLGLGPLNQWKNKGALGGAFYPLNAPPTVEDVAGRKAVRLRSCAWAVPMDFQAMAADFYAPQEIDGAGPFTVAAWLYNPSPLGIDGMRETVLGWQALSGDDGTQIGYGAEGRYSHEKGANGGAYDGPMGGVGFPDKSWPVLNQWHHIAYVFTGGRGGVFRIYIDGKLANEKTFDRIVRNLPASDIGKTEAAINADLFLRDAKPVKVFAYIGERDGYHWRWEEKWLQVLDLGQHESGKVSVKLSKLKPGTRYYCRFYLQADNETRWSDGAASFVTESADGTPGKALAKTDGKLMFLGCAWGINWVWDVKPVNLYTGGIADLKLYSSALSEREVRNLYGEYAAYAETPENGTETQDVTTTLGWKPCVDGVKAYRVYMSGDKAAVERGDASALKAEEPQAAFDPGKLDLGKTYYWRVDEVAEDGKQTWPGPVWSFTAQTGRAADPKPADKSDSASIYTSKLSWKPGKFVEKQRVYLGTDRKAVENGAALWVSPELPKDQTAFPVEGTWENLRLDYGRTYYWRVEEINGAGLPPTKGDVWQFTVENYFEPEFDGIVSEPFPSVIRQDGFYGKLLEGNGHPVIAPGDCPDLPMRICSYTTSRMLRKRPDVLDVLEALNCATHLDYGDRGWGWSEFTTASYGSVRTFYNDPTFYWGINILLHEMGHQYHMFGGEQTDYDFRARLHDLFRANKFAGRWVGDYGANNIWEYIAVCASAFVSDGSEDDVICHRETLRQIDPPMYYFLEDYWPGDMAVELHPMSGLQAAADGKVVSWDNSGGLEYFGKFGLKKYPETVGAFEPKGAPKLDTVNGVTAVTFGGKDALVWNRRTREFLIGNQAWSVELWAYKSKMGRGDEVMLSWGPADNGASFVWGAGSRAFDHAGVAGAWKTKPSLARWHHLVYTFKGGGLENGQGEYRIYVDGALDGAGKFKLDLPGKQPIVVGAALDGARVASGFTGAFAHVRVYDYNLTDLQVKKHYAEENDYYRREPLQVAGALLVDLDARRLAPCPAGENRPLYPKATSRDWVRSWFNRGAIAGKMHNDRRAPEGSDPHLKDVAGVTAIEFYTNDRMVSSFVPSDQMRKSPALTLEAWVRRSASDPGRTILQWGDILLAGASIRPGTWRHLALTLRNDEAQLYVDGRLRSTVKGVKLPGQLDRLNLGARWDGRNWRSCFDGAIAQVRLHSGLLTADQIRSNFAASELQLASHPFPADGGRVAAERRIPLSWNPGVRVARRDHDVFLSTDAQQVASGRTNSPCYLGRAGARELTPRLKAGTTYYWRVDGLDTGGRAISRGRIWSFKTYDGLLVDLDAAKLGPGKVETWANQGRAGGRFTKGSYRDQAAPTVKVVEGRKGLDFTGAKCLVSSFPAPKGITGGGDFTVSVWAFKSWFNEQETMLSWGSRPGGTAEFSDGFGKQSGAFKTSGGFATGYTGSVEQPDLYRNNSPMLYFWNNIVYTYTGAPDGLLRIYINGILNTEKKVNLSIARDGRIALGGVLKDDGGWEFPFSGLLSDIAIYDYPLAKDEVAFLCDGTGKRPDDTRLLVRLESGNLPEGKLTTWKNLGAAAGEFGLPERKRTEPVAETVAGRRAVTFDGKFTFMQSDIAAPKSVTWRNPFTVEMWVYNPKVDENETVFSLAPRQAFKATMLEDFIRRAAEFRYGSGEERSPAAFSTGWDYHNTGWKNAKHPEAGKWRHIAYVYDGERQGRFTVFADGRPVHTREWFTLCTYPGLPMHLGAAWNTDTGESDLFSGSLASLRVYDYARTGEEIRRTAAGR